MARRFNTRKGVVLFQQR
ncbi:BnaA02g17060D [Brassica napus]|uniref:BnaA02g17060D protein n=2 Tax=Brassica napus TaxID=3708 RepID=A0A078I5C0_BRANA|nr:BnaA02g17060D [Brassica napus]